VSAARAARRAAAETAPPDDLPRVEYRDGLHLVDSVVWFDATRVHDLAFVSHAGVGGLLPHRKIVTTEPTLRLLRALHPGAAARLRAVDLLASPYGRTFSLGALDLSLLPAGHVLGSAQLLVRTARDRTVLYAGDVCLDRRATAEPCEVRRADVLVLDPTFGAPAFRFPPRAEVRARILEWCRAQLAAGAVPVLVASPLGGAPELARLCGEAGLPVRAHATIYRVARAFAALGVELNVKRLGAAPHAGEVVLVPPGAQAAPAVAAAAAAAPGWSAARFALCSAWSALPEVAARAQVHAAFALSDHAGADALVRFAEAVAPRVTYLTRAPDPELAAALGRFTTIRAVPPPAQLDLFQGA